jgi:predicted nucleotidyltransferase component of viral defense system
MIDRQEIDAKAGELGVHTSNVQRDYVFGWLLAGLAQAHNVLQPSLVLKGGNCFRKAYFEHARFSNDLDFSTQTELHADRLLEGLRQACVFASERSGVDFLVDESRVSERRLADREARMYDARVYFKSFYGEEDVRIRVDLDVKEYDRLFLAVQSRRLIHAYSDAASCQADIRCVKLEELLASKLKALLQRQHSPDLYDFVHAVFFQKSLAISRREVLTTFLKQTIYEPEPLIARNLLLELPFQAIRGLWNEYLVCPKLSLFSFDDAETWFRNVIAEIFAISEPQFAYAGIPGPSPGRATLSYFPSGARADIMESARLHRLLRFVYDGLERIVEPYALVFKRRRDGVGREYFYGWDRVGGRSREIGIKSYIADKVHSVTILEETFEPRYPIELTKSAGYFGNPYFSTSRASGYTAPRAKRAQTSFGNEYTVECPYCNKRFKRSSYDTKLNEHKDRYGNRCYGRVGYMV